MARNSFQKTAANRRRASIIADVADLFRTLIQGLDQYRPEQHYMRGPGPRWHAKYAPVRLRAR